MHEVSFAMFHHNFTHVEILINMEISPRTNIETYFKHITNIILLNTYKTTVFLMSQY